MAPFIVTMICLLLSLNDTVWGKFVRIRSGFRLLAFIFSHLSPTDADDILSSLLRLWSQTASKLSKSDNAVKQTFKPTSTAGYTAGPPASLCLSATGTAACPMAACTLTASASRLRRHNWERSVVYGDRRQRHGRGHAYRMRCAA